MYGKMGTGVVWNGEEEDGCGEWRVRVRVRVVSGEWRVARMRWVQEEDWSWDMSGYVQIGLDMFRYVQICSRRLHIAQNTFEDAPEPTLGCRVHPHPEQATSIGLGSLRQPARQPLGAFPRAYPHPSRIPEQASRPAPGTPAPPAAAVAV
jgi:hypothetical protein